MKRNMLLALAFLMVATTATATDNGLNAVMRPKTSVHDAIDGNR